MTAWLELEDTALDDMTEAEWQERLAADWSMQMIHPQLSLELFATCESMEFRHLPFGPNLADQPDWLLHDWRILNWRRSTLRKSPKRKTLREAEKKRRKRKDRHKERYEKLKKGKRPKGPIQPEF